MAAEKIKKSQKGLLVLETEPQLKSNAARSIKSLKKQLESEYKSKEPIYLVLNTISPTSREKEYVPRIVPLNHRLSKPENLKILLVTKDPVLTYKQPLQEKGTPTEDIFTEIISFKRFRQLVTRPKEATKLCHEYDLVLVDHRLHHLLPPILSKTIFVKNNKKYPLMIQMAKPTPDATLTKSKRSHKLKDERVEPDYVYRQVKSIAKNTTFVPSTGTCISVVVGYSNFEVEELVSNIDNVLNYLISPEYKPVGGVIRGGFKGIEDMHVKSSESISLPILSKK